MNPPSKNCDDLKAENGGTLNGGIYWLDLSGNKDFEKIQQVECNPDGSTVILNRQSDPGYASDYFNRELDYYMQGFGELDKEIFIGFKALDKYI